MILSFAINAISILIRKKFQFKKSIRTISIIWKKVFYLLSENWGVGEFFSVTKDFLFYLLNNSFLISVAEIFSIFVGGTCSIISYPTPRP